MRSTIDEKVRNPQRNLPIGILGSLVIRMAIDLVIYFSYGRRKHR